MSGGKSETTEEQSSTQSSVSGVNTGKIVQAGGNVTQDEIQTKIVASSHGTINVGSIEQIPDGVSNAFLKIIETVNKSLDVNQSTTAAGQKIISDTTASAIAAVAQRAEGADQPDLSVITKLTPVIMLGIVAVGLIAVFKK